MQKQISPLAVSVSEAVRMIGLGRTTLYAVIAAGKLKTRKCGRRTLIETESLRQFIAELPESDGSHTMRSENKQPVAPRHDPQA